MTARQVSAPGKLFLLGEYAVLDGAPALLSAVDARVRVSVSAAEHGYWTLSTPGLGIAAQKLRPGGELPAAVDGPTRKALRVFDSVRKTLAAAGELPAEPLDVLIDSTAFTRNGRKLGLGSSAAVAVALTAALHATSDRQLDRPELFRLADAAHRAAQGGTGSGGDVAASVYGGLISYTRGEVPTSLDWPDGLSVMAVATGDGSSTTELVAGVDAYRERDAEGYRSDIRQLAALSGRARDALDTPSAFLALCSEYFLALVEFDAHAQVGIITERHRELSNVASSVGGVFKTSGAGGGDLGLAFSLSGAPTEALKEALSTAGAEPLPLTFGADGVRVEAHR